MVKKKNDKIFTPSYYVKHMLDLIGYSGPSVLKKHIIDNSCGDGAFLEEIVRRYVDAYCSWHNTDTSDPDVKKTVVKEVYRYVHGIEIDRKVHEECLKNLNDVMSRIFGPGKYKFDIMLGDTLVCDRYDGKMDFVIGNPPYINCHNFEEDRETIKGYSFCKGGMSDIYLAFFEKGLKMLNRTGELCYITPSSWTTSVSGYEFRKYISDEGTLRYVEDYGHKNVFKGCSNYVMITIFDNEIKNRVDVQVVDHNMETMNMVSHEDFNIGGKFYFSIGGNIPLRISTPEGSFIYDDGNVPLRDILLYDGTEYVKVKNGFATLNDKVFMGEDVKELDFYVIDCYKATTGGEHRCFYPYDEEGNLVELNELMCSSADVVSWLAKHKNDLLKHGKNEGCWWGFGRTQAINDVFNTKRVAVTNLVKDMDGIKTKELKDGEGVFAGFYVLLDKDGGPSAKWVMETIRSQGFIDYVKCIGTYKSGGYYTYTSKDLAQYLNYRFSKGE